MKSLKYKISNNIIFEYKLLYYFKNKKNIVFLNSNKAEKKNFFAVSDTDKNRIEDWQFGFISYDYKNEIEQLFSANLDKIEFPIKHFFSPELLFEILGEEVRISFKSDDYTDIEINTLFQKVDSSVFDNFSLNDIKIHLRVSKEEYLKNVKALKEHILLGDIYEINYCQEFYAEDVEINPIDIYIKLNKNSPTPYACFVKYDHKYLMSSSPERFIKKNENRIVSQPIKGTIKRGGSSAEDERLKEELYTDPKERSENIMIVDLVRNDLSKISEKNSVKVDELCKIYTFPQLHQMISTVSGTVKKNVNFQEILKATFPMGSMTGAPKIRAMQLIEKYEETKRGLYSGAVGYINKENDFDFNVVIRSILYNKENRYLSFIVGGAITDQSDPEKEYDECLLKAKAMLDVLRN